MAVSTTYLLNSENSIWCEGGGIKKMAVIYFPRLRVYYKIEHYVYTPCVIRYFACNDIIPYIYIFIHI